VYKPVETTAMGQTPHSTERILYYTRPVSIIRDNKLSW